MSLTLGINCGFVLSQPDGNPNAGNSTALDEYNFAQRDTTPSGSYYISEIGFYSLGTIHAGGAWKAAIYTDSSDMPGSIVSGSLQTGQSTTANSAQWYRYTGLNISILPDTIYWIAAGHEDVAGAVDIPRVVGSTGNKAAYNLYANTPSVALNEHLHAIYALLESSSSGLSIPVAMASYRRRRI